MSGRKVAAKRRHSRFDSTYQQSGLTSEEFCLRRERAFPVRLTNKQIHALEALMARRHLFFGSHQATSPTG